MLRVNHCCEASDAEREDVTVKQLVQTQPRSELRGRFRAKREQLKRV